MSDDSSGDFFNPASPSLLKSTEIFFQSINSVEEVFSPAEPILSYLNSYCLLEIKGPDAEKFMQGQFTCDVASITELNHGLGSCYNNKGRMLALFAIAKPSAERFILRLPLKVAESLSAHLSKYKAFFNCSCEILPDWKCVSLLGEPDSLLSEIAKQFENNRNLISGHHEVILRSTDNNNRFEFWFDQQSTEPQINRLLSECQPVDETIWNLTEVLSGIGEIYPSTVGEYIPQMFNLQALGGVSFKKGCYTGQEIVARMQYLGKLKKRLYLLELKGKTLDINDKVYDDNQTTTGTLVRTATLSDRHQMALAVIENQPDLHEKSLWAGDNREVEVHLRPLPYEVPAQENQRPRQKL